MNPAALCIALLCFGFNANLSAQEVDARQRAILKRIYRFGDAETRRGKVYLASMRDATDKDLSVLKDIPDVVFLDVAYNTTDGSALVHISAMSNLEKLWLHNNQIKDGNLKHLRSLGKLRMLDLCDTPIGDEGARFVSLLTGLEELRLDKTSVTDAGLVHIAKLKNLRQLSLAETYVTRAGVDRLKKTMPKLRVWYVPWKPVEANRPNRRRGC